MDKDIRSMVNEEVKEMLTAINSRGKVFQIGEGSSRLRLRELRETEKFYCRACEGQVVLKVGELMIPHFAHKKVNECQLFSEGETAAHLLGKQRLFRYFKREKIDVILEAYIPAIQQRPDLLIRKKGKLTAIEFQCSPISLSDMKRRTKGYIDSGLEVFWIPNAMKHFRLGLQVLKLTAFQKACINKGSLLTVNSQRATFEVSEVLLPLYGQLVISFNNSQSMKFSCVRKPFAEVNEQEITEKWLFEKQRYLKNRLRFSKKMMKDSFIKFCYEEKISLLELPNWVGMPSREVHKVHPVEWQLIIAVLLKKGIVEEDLQLVLSEKYPQIALGEGAINDYVSFLKRSHSSLKWIDLKNDSISEEIYNQYVALKFDN